MTRWRAIGPGIVIAATGLGAGDLIAASVAGAHYGTAVLWVVAAGAVLKFVLNENLARWQLTTGSTVMQALVERLPTICSWYFLIYLLLWSFVVAAALMAACGMAIHALFPTVSVRTSGIVQSLLAVVLVLVGRYAWLERLMKLFIALMFAVVIICAVLVSPDWLQVMQGLLLPRVPEHSSWFLLGVLGGIGGSVTLLSYGYWIREKDWKDASSLAQVRLDLGAAYLLTALFGIGIMVIAAAVPVESVAGKQIVIAIAEQLENRVGALGKWCFLIGFWGAVFSSMLGVWQGIPYLFADFVGHHRQAGSQTPVSTNSLAYRGFLVYLSLPPMLLLWLDKPVWLVLLYSITGAAFVPLLGSLLLYLNNRPDWIGNLRNRVLSNVVLLAGLTLFIALLGYKLYSML